MHHSNLKIRLLGVSILSIFLLAGCTTGPAIRSNMDTSVDFNRFSTFGFFEPLATDREGFQSLISQQLIASTERELVARGMQRADSNPDLLINFSANLDQRLRVRQAPAVPAGGMNRHRRGFYNTWPMYQQTEIRQYTKGTVGIDVVDASRKQLIWEGFAIGRVTQQTMNNISPVLNDAVVEIFGEFPLPPK
jgi:hypothetical protein